MLQRKRYRQTNSDGEVFMIRGVSVKNTSLSSILSDHITINATIRQLSLNLMCFTCYSSLLSETIIPLVSLAIKVRAPIWLNGPKVLFFYDDIIKSFQSFFCFFNDSIIKSIQSTLG